MNDTCKHGHLLHECCACAYDLIERLRADNMWASEEETVADVLADRKRLRTENKRQRAVIESLRRTLIIVANVGSGEAKRIALADLRALDGGDDE